jgi:hypothetical protein
VKFVISCKLGPWESAAFLIGELAAIGLAFLLSVAVIPSAFLTLENS